MVEVPGTLELSFLVRFRWGALAAGGVLAAIATFGFGLPVSPWLPALLLVGAASNAALALAGKRASSRSTRQGVLLVALAFDVLLLTGVLWESGGASNPFSIVYLLEVMLAAILLGPRATWAVVVLSAAGYGSLFLGGRAAMHHDPAGFQAHLYGMWLAFAFAAGLLALFVGRLASSLRRREEELEKEREKADRAERLASLSTLAAGAAHELGTPLGTIAVAARELERSLEDGSAREDVRLIRAAVQRCRDILDQLGADAGQSTGEPFRPVPLAQVVEAALQRVRPQPPVRVEAASDAVLTLPRKALAQALAGLIVNAQDASPPDGEVTVRIARRSADMAVEVRDAGAGMSDEVRRRAGEPFFTTKPTGQGMGLGLYLARALVERLGGTLELHSEPGKGTSAVVSLPAPVPEPQ